jgi:DNA adenine methylase
MGRLLESNNLVDGHYAEPYAGGAGLALSLLFADYIRHIHINDLDRSVYAFWWAVLYDTEALCRLISDTPVTPSTWRRQKAIQSHKATSDLLSLAFSSFFLNRTNRSGIIATGGMIGGKLQAGKWALDARYNRRHLVARIQRIASHRSRISVTNLDAVEFVARMASVLPERSLTYLDPPYYVKGQQRLYANYYCHTDHQVVADVLDSYPHCWVVSYDYAPEIMTLYRHHRCLVYTLPYTASVRRRGAEAVFFSDELQLSAARACATDRGLRTELRLSRA